MIGYVTIGASDFEASKLFYDKALAGLGARRGVVDTEREQGFTTGGGAVLIVCRPFDGKPPTSGNGTMVALSAPSRETVNKVHADALAAGGKDEGAPGDRGGGFYGAYFRDLDGNKICVFKMG